MSDSQMWFLAAVFWMGLGTAHDNDALRAGALVAIVIAAWKQRRGEER